jgi:hypothetical protein
VVDATPVVAIVKITSDHICFLHSVNVMGCLHATLEEFAAEASRMLNATARAAE